MSELRRTELPNLPEDKDAPHKERLPFRLARFLSWVSLLLILASSMLLAIFIGNSARDTLLSRQQDYSLLLGNNLNHQIIRRFIFPTARVTGGVINMSEAVQYNRLDEVVRETIRGLDIDSLRIYNEDNVVSYSLKPSEMGHHEEIPVVIRHTLSTGEPGFEKVADVSWLKAMFMLDLKPNTFVLRMSFPLSVTLPGSDNAEPLVLGAMEILKDVTSDHEIVIRFQWFILMLCLGSSVVLFALLQASILRAEEILAERMSRTRRLEAQIHENERLISMGRVIASIAHEIRNPLGIIRSSSELLLRRTKDGDNTNKRILTAIYDESKRLSQTVNDFLDYARPRVARKDPVDLGHVLEQALGFLEGELNHGSVSVSRELPVPFMVLGDKDLLYRVLYNILTNSLQAMEKGGDIIIRGRVRSDSLVELEIRDTGPGFPPDDITHVMDPFFTTKDHGTGLGLAIVNTIIAGHGGHMFLSNAPEGGAVTRILLPAMPVQGDQK